MLVTSGLHLSAQQEGQFSHYMFNKYEFNPAYAGFDFSLNVTGIYRNQWNGLEGSPKTINLNAHLPFYLWNGALGFDFLKESIGAEDNVAASASYNYVYSSDIGLFSAGLRLGFFQKQLNGNELRSPEGIYEGNTINHNDPLLSSNRTSGITGIWDFGVYYINDQYEGGLAISRLPKGKISLDNTGIALETHINAFFQFNYQYSDQIEIASSIMLRSDFNQVQTDVSSVVEINGNIFGGLSLRGYNSRSLDALILLFGTRLNENYKLSYSYDIGISDIKRVNEGTHELMLNYNLNKLIGSGLPTKIIYNPRNL